MVRKLLIWGIYILFTVLLLIGALNRTLVKLAANNGADGVRGNGNPTGIATTALVPSTPDTITVATTPVVVTATAAKNQVLVENKSDGQESEKLSLRIQVIQNGQVDSLKRNNATLVLDDSRQVNFAGRGWRYAKSLGFSIQAGDQLAFEGYEEEGTIKIKSLINLRTGQKVILRDEAGHPLWDGGDED
jgi:hypothetical protein